jgi:hypothetical protein
VIRKGDLLTVDIYELRGPGMTDSNVVRVSEQGMISLPFIGHMIAEHRTATEVGAAVAKAYQVVSFLAEPQNDVRVADERPRIPAWRLAALFGLAPAAWLLMTVILARRCHRRVCRGRCTACGYDLRASPGRCPECGALAEGVAA